MDPDAWVFRVRLDGVAYVKPLWRATCGHPFVPARGDTVEVEPDVRASVVQVVWAAWAPWVVVELGELLVAGRAIAESVLLSSGWTRDEH